MNNSEKYLFKDFTSENYLYLLKLLKARFKISNFSTYNLKEKFAIIRHDMDFSVQRALKIAELEAGENIKAHYYILLHSEFYNLLEKQNVEKIKEIIALGHKIGLHFDTNFYNIQNEEQLESKLIFEKEIIEKIFNIEVTDFSFHITNKYTETCTKEFYAGLQNIYSEAIKKNITYCSDSNGYWRYQRLEEVIKGPQTKNLQILTHPELWQDEIMSPKQRVYRCIDGRAESTKNWYENILKINGRENIDW